MPPTATVTALKQATAGLSYTSESDAPWAAFAWVSAAGEPTADGVRKKGRHKADAPAAEQAVDEFFAPLTAAKDWHGDDEKAAVAKYAALRDLVKAKLTAPKVVRVGEVNVTVYVVGGAAEGGWAGVKTTAVET